MHSWNHSFLKSNLQCYSSPGKSSKLWVVQSVSGIKAKFLKINTILKFAEFTHEGFLRKKIQVTPHVNVFLFSLFIPQIPDNAEIMN